VFEDGGAMSNVALEERVGALEGDVSRLRTDVAVLGRDVHEVKQQGTTILQAIQGLERRDASRPPPTNWRAVAATTLAIAAGIGGTATSVWWFIETSPSVRELDKRLSRLDDPEVGKIGRLQDEVRWMPTLKK
jgi:hypothetical protein